MTHPPSAPRSCESCRCWEPRAGGAWGECRARPPSLEYGDAAGHWPRMARSDWCGEWSPRPPLDTRAEAETSEECAARLACPACGRLRAPREPCGCGMAGAPSDASAPSPETTPEGSDAVRLARWAELSAAREAGRLAVEVSARAEARALAWAAVAGRALGELGRPAVSAEALGVEVPAAELLEHARAWRGGAAAAAPRAARAVTAWPLGDSSPSTAAELLELVVAWRRMGAGWWAKGHGWWPGAAREAARVADACECPGLPDPDTAPESSWPWVCGACGLVWPGPVGLPG